MFSIPDFMKASEHKTLGGNITPLNYNLEFDTDLKSFLYFGTVKIKVRVKNSSRVIKLNASKLKVKSVRVISKNGVQIARHILNQREETLWLMLDKPVVGQTLIEIDFIGTNTEGMYGFYRSSYKHGSKTEYMLTTQFEAADARAAFPCFDEPEFKATFDVTLVVDRDLTAISNMPVKSMGENSGRKSVTFCTTPRMSTYLLYLGVGRYEELHSHLGRTKISVLTTPGKKELAKLSMAYAKKFISFYQKYFGIGYPLPKIDLIAVPDFAANAMENWGAITFRETALLGTEKSPILIKQRIAEVVAHELAHQWFGDLVTMEWWDDLWLNESFATFMSYKAMDAVFPMWDIRAKYLEDVIGTAFEADEVKSTHPISVHVNTPEQISAIFDRISYEKGGTVLHMLENYAGAEAFRQGLHDYLEAHKYGNATKYDLLNSIDKEVRKKSRLFQFTKVASYWIEDADYPIINVIKKAYRFELTQGRFVISNAKGSDQIWPIPLRYISEKDAKEKFLLMDKKSLSIRTNGSKWIKLNHGQHDLYRVRYQKGVLARLGEIIKSKRLSSIDAWGVENDLFVLARTGGVPVEDYFDFVKKYCLESDYPLNINIATHLAWLYTMLFETKKLRELKDTATDYLAGMMKGIGWCTLRNEPSKTTIFRGAVIRSLGMLDRTEVLDRANLLFKNFVLKGKNIDMNIRSAVYFLVAWSGDEGAFDKLASLYKKEMVPDEKIRFLQALAMFKKEKLAKRALDFSISENVKLQDSFIIPQFMALNPISKRYLWPWTKANWKRLMKKYAVGTNLLPRYVSNLSEESNIETKRDIESFFSSKQNMREDIRRALKQTLERIDANIGFMQKNNLIEE